ncbi:hypothetical protein V5O48_003575 [Marasmius crinis-equi]|uniref:PhoD-like phosphatase metallophosphatase domain-containing protein n=1 Tax=Marasmius crinis-equi TaxID=585013 RepID=A0ABR3FSI6_9AGAR
MSVLFYIAAVSSSLFRIASYIFLRVIPTRAGPIALPILYLLSLTSLLVPSNSKRQETEVKKEATTKEANGAVKKESEEETSFLTEKGPSPLSQVVFSLPSFSSAVRRTNFVINALLAVAAADLILTPRLDTSLDVVFSRVGAVYPDSVKIVARYPNVAEPVHISWRELSKSNITKPWKQGPALQLVEENDWTDTVTLKGLWPGSRYEYILSNNETTPLDSASSPISFRTFPDPKISSGKSLRFVATSCVTPNFPWAPFQWRTIKGFDYLADYIWPQSSLSDVEEENPTTFVQTPPETDFMLFLGDFIYADVPLYAGNDRESYRRLYRRNYNSPSFRKVYEKLPIFFTYDDHEIINNYDGGNNDSKIPFPSASSAFATYNANSNYDSSTDDVYYYDFRYGDIAFFVMDARRYRSEKSEDPETRTMLGETQLQALQDWLVRVNHTATFKFLVSSTPFTSLWTHDAQLDTWAAYPTEKQTLLTMLHSVPNVVVLSGDRHEFAAIEFTGDGPYPVTEFSTSPLSMFYIPFVRTLQSASSATVTKEFTITKEDEEGNPIVVTETEEVPRERVLKYIAEGNHKWLELPGYPVQLQSTSTALGAFVASGVKDLFNKIGMHPGSWF